MITNPNIQQKAFSEVGTEPRLTAKAKAMPLAPHNGFFMADWLNKPEDPEYGGIRQKTDFIIKKGITGFL